MKGKLLYLCSFLLLSQISFAQQTRFETSKGLETSTYDEAISFYRALDQKFLEARLVEYGSTDIGKPLHVFVMSKNKTFAPGILHAEKKVVLLINNGIHPGEPEGIDASMLWARELLEKKKLPDDVVICIIPIYNTDGSLNRSCCSRVNQNGPLEYGFRGNARNLDLNRDFIKTDSKNSETFQKIFQEWKPEVLVDNHTSNGADYQYVLTYIATQKNKLNPIVSSYLYDKMVPRLDTLLKERKFEMTPYVNVWEHTPDSGFVAFNESPRYSTGYSALFNSIGFVVETHMWKPFDQRVWATYAFMDELTNILQKDHQLIVENKLKADANVKSQTDYAMDWDVDYSKESVLNFKGFTAKYKASEVSGLERLYYDRSEPYQKKIKYFKEYKPTLTVQKPVAYVVPQAWVKVMDLMKLNGVKLTRLDKDSTFRSEVYYIADCKSPSRPYEGHFLHSGVKINKDTLDMKFYKGDYIIETNQSANRYIVETLEPQGIDSFFAWNFFDSILGQKEGFSDYLFEDMAADMLKKDPALKAKLEAKQKADPKFAQSAYAQLDFVYKNSKYYEPTHNRYPVVRLIR